MWDLELSHHFINPEARATEKANEQDPNTIAEVLVRREVCHDAELMDANHERIHHDGKGIHLPRDSSDSSFAALRGQPILAIWEVDGIVRGDANQRTDASEQG